MNELIRVVVIDDHYVTRNGIINLLSASERIEVVAEGWAGNHVAELIEKMQPDVLITDLQMPANEKDPKGALFAPITGLAKIAQRFPNVALFVISQEDDIQTIQSLAEIGVRGYMLKTDNVARVLHNAIEMTQAGGVYFSPDVREVIKNSPKIRAKGRLTPRQFEVIQAIIRSPDADRDQVADSLDISRSTMQKHITAIYRALGVTNMESCIIKVIRMGLVDYSETNGHSSHVP